MTPDDLRAMRRQCGLSQQALADLLQLGACGGRTIREWESGRAAISGPVAIAVKSVLKQRLPA